MITIDELEKLNNKTQPARPDAEIIKKIEQLKAEKKAIILAHNYQIGEVQDIADYVGDSLGLSQQAAKTNADIIVFAGVDFMAETAAILCPDKKVIHTEKSATCPMANMLTVESLIDMKKNYPGVPVVTYVNSSAAVKTESDWCCTSANAIQVVQAVDSDRIIFVPDRYLGIWVKSQVDKEIILWPGYCPTHQWITKEDIEELQSKHPDAKVIVHPECTPEVTAIADEVLSTGGMCRFAKETNFKKMIIGTETGILHRLRKENPDKVFYPVSDRIVCPNMKMTDLEKVLWALEDTSEPIVISEEVREKALIPIKRMLSITQSK